MMKQNEGVGDRVRRFRRHRKLTQQALADLAAVDKGYISRLEAGEIADPGVDLVERLSKALEVSMRHLADPRWYAGEAKALPDWEAAILAVPSNCLSDEDKHAIVRFVRTIIGAKTSALMLGAVHAATTLDPLLPT
jgi:transcriptional regulator with XRE-family HTH domain